MQVKRGYPSIRIFSELASSQGDVMRLENAQDPRRVLCERKFFGIRPQPLERYLYGLSLSQTAERVFWLHWDEGNKRGNFISEIPIRTVARYCNANPSTITRAYQALADHGLIRRQDPGRDLSKPFNQAIAVTEVTLPRAALRALLDAPERRSMPAKLSPTSEPHSEESTSEAHLPEQTEDLNLEQAWQNCLEGLKSRLSEHDFTSHIRPLQAHSGPGTLTLFAPNRFVQEWVEREGLPTIHELLEHAGVRVTLRIVVGARPSPTNAPEPRFIGVESLPAPTPPRRLNQFCQAQLRKELSKLALGSSLEQRFYEIVWSVEEGALAGREVKFAINTALKLVRNGEWTRPNRMPKSWRVVAA